jgi:peptide/nickel transport system substrate-binding protein
VSFIGWGGVEASSGLRGLIACENPAKGLGVVNWSKYCNPKLDAVLMKALATMDDAGRDKLLQEAAAMASQDVALIPLYFQVSAWGVKKGITYSGRRDERTFAHLFKPQ